MPEKVAAEPTRSAAGTVAAGIFASRLMGFLREAATGYFFGVSAFTDVLRVALRMPNALQNLLGEGTISAAFIPIYSRFLDAGRDEDAGRFAGAIFSLLFVVVSATVLAGIALAEPLTAFFAPGFLDDAAKVASGELPADRFTLCVRAVRYIFPMTGVLVLSAWALGVLNSHRRFFVPYVAPVLWNVAMIGGLFLGAYLFAGRPAMLAPERLVPEEQTDILFAFFVGALVGGVLQFAVQLPLVARLLSGFRLSLSLRVRGVGEALKATGPVLAGRGAAQLSAYLDQVLASLLVAGAVGALGFAQTLYLLPISLFGMSVVASELPELSRLGSGQQEAFTARVQRSVRQIAFLTIPSVVGYLAFGFLIVMAVFGRGEFGVPSGWLVYAVLGGYSLGLLATTLSRLLQNSFWALGDTKTPAKIALLRIAISAALSAALMFWLDRFPVAETVGVAAGADLREEPLRFGAAGLALGASVAALAELGVLYRSLRKRMDRLALPWPPLLQMAGLAALAALPAALLWWLLPPWPYLVLAALVVGAYGTTYLGLAHLAGLAEADAWVGRLLRRRTS